MKQNTVFLSLLLAAAALLTYSGTTRPDLIASSSQQGYLLVREPMESYGRAFQGQQTGPGFVGTWVYSIATADFPSSHVVTHTLTLREDGTALLTLENKNRVGAQTGLPQYKTDTNTKKGTWLERGGEVWIDLEELV